MFISTAEAKNRLSELLGEVARGGEVTITKRGVAVAKLVPAASAFDQEAARQAATGLRELSRGVTLGGVGIKALVEEGRRS